MDTSEQSANGAQEARDAQDDIDAATPGTLTGVGCAILLVVGVAIIVLLVGYLMDTRR